MVKNFKSVFVNVHGSSLHSFVIFKVCFWLVNHGFKIDSNPEVWSERVSYPGIPDVIASKYNRRVKSKKIIIREVESRYSKKSYDKKIQQFNTQWIDFDVIDIGKLERCIDDRLSLLKSIPECRIMLNGVNSLVDSWVDSEMSRCLD